MKVEQTEFGFRWGDVEVVRMFTARDGTQVIEVRHAVTGKGMLVTVSPKGRRVASCVRDRKAVPNA